MPKENLKKKGLAHIEFAKIEEVLEFTLVGACVGGWRLKCSDNSVEFRKIGVILGSLIFGASVFLGTSFEVVLGFSIYNIEGSLIGLIAGTSMEAALGALIGALSIRYDVVLCGSMVGLFVNGMKYAYDERNFNKITDMPFNFIEKNESLYSFTNITMDKAVVLGTNSSVIDILEP